MSRSRSFRRASRLLFICLAAVVMVGSLAYTYELRKRLREKESQLAQNQAATRPIAPTEQALAVLDPTQSRALLPAEDATSKSPTTTPAVLVTSTPTATTGKRAAVAGTPTVAPTAAHPTTTPARITAAASATRPAAAPVAHGPAAKLLTDAKSKADAGDLMAARNMLNEPLVAGGLTGADADAARTQLMQFNTKLVFSSQRFSDPSMDEVQVESSRTLTATARQHAVPWEAVCRVNNTSDRRIRAGQTLKVPKGPFSAVITKGAFRLDLYLGGLPGESGAVYVWSVPVGLGKDDSTPTGQWIVTPASKGRNLDWTNPRTNEHFAGADPKNPLGGFWIGLHGEEGNAVNKTSYGIHGTIEPDSIGKQASMGCIRLRHDDISLVYDLLIEGKSRVLVKD